MVPNQPCDEILAEAINKSLSKTFGDFTARSIRFYVDTNIALNDTSVYESSLERMFGPTACEAVLKNIMGRINQTFELGADSWPNLKVCVHHALEKCTSARRGLGEPTEVGV